MIFVTGGAFQGQEQWVTEYFAIAPGEILDGGTATDEELMKAKAVSRFHLLVKRWIGEGKLPMDMMAEVLEKNSQIIIINQEIGCGIVPMDPQERELREVHGRTCCILTKEAESVIRVICGIGQKIR